ncbi:MAG: tetratricopeptide repeat protein [Terracidiphilus sp.]
MISIEQYEVTGFHKFIRTLCAFCLMMMVGLCTAQEPKPAVESPSMKQLHQAISAADRGDKKQAMELTDTLLAQHPDFESALKLRGMLLEDAGRMYEAGESYQKALRLAPNDAELLLKVGIYQLVAGDKEQAVRLLTHHLKLAPRDGDALYYVAQAYHLTGHDDLALKAIKECVRIEPGNASVLQKYGELLCSSGDCEAGLQSLLKAQQVDPTLERIDFAIGVASFRDMDFATAKKFTTRAAEREPNDPNVLSLLGSVEVKLSEWQGAKTVLERVVAMKPDDVASMLELGHCELELGNDQAAIVALDRVLKLDPTQIIAHFYLSRAFAGLGQTAKAQHEAELHHKMMDQMSFVPSFESSGSDASIQGEARRLLTEHKEEDARKLFLDTFKGDAPTQASAYVFVGKVYLFMNDAEDGVRSLQRALQIEPTVRGAHTYEGILALKQGDLDTAEREFQSELGNDPNYQTAIAEMGEIRYRQGRWAEAAQQLEKSRTMVPQLLFMECDAYFHSGDVKNADLTAETLAAYGRNESDVMQGLMELLNRNGQTELAQRLASN